MSIRPIRRLLKLRHGSALVESAMVLPLFLLIVVGTLEFTLCFTSYLSATYAARYGARYAAMHSNTSPSPASTSQVQAVIQSQIFLPNVIPANETILVLYGNRSNPYAQGSGNYKGDLVGIGVIWTQTIHLPWGTSQTLTLNTQAYRVITN